MKRNPVRDWLDRLLGGDQMEPGDLDQFVDEQTEEGQLHDFKSGLIFTRDIKDARMTVRSYVSGFANSDGGLLILGVSEKSNGGATPRKVDGCHPTVGKTPLTEWAKTTIQDMAPYFGNAPRMQTVQHNQGHVLVIAVDRAPTLVPCVESRELKYFLRLHDTTLEAPAFLVEDLVLGRRQKPALMLRPTGMPMRFDSSARILECQLGLVVENQGLLSAKNIQVGMVTWTLPGTVGFQSSQLERAIESKKPVTSAILRHIKGEPSNPRYPVDAHPFEISAGVELRSFAVQYPGNAYPLKAALYATADGHAPQWFQLSISMMPGMESQMGNDPLQRITVEATHGMRPIVSWN